MMHQRIDAANQPSPLSSSRWCILRTAAPRTLLLADSLADAGFEVWTPRELRPVRMKLVDRNRRSPRKPTAAAPDKPAAIMPTFVFARGTDQDIANLAAIIALPVSPHPQFSFFHYAGRIPTISGHSMTALRERETRARHRERHNHAPGTSVRVQEQSAFVGLTGTVKSCDGKRAVICFGPLEIEVASWQAVPDEVTGGQHSPTGSVAGHQR